MKFYDKDLDQEELKKEYLKLNSHCTFKDAKELQNKVDEYFNMCNTNRRPYSVSGLALYLGLTTQTLRNYEKSYGDTEYADIIKVAKQKIEEFAECCLYDNRKCSGAKFVLENCYDGWTNKNDVNLSGNIGFRKLEDILSESNS